MLKRCIGLFGVLGLGAATVAGAAVIPEPDVQVSPTGLHLVLNLPQARLFQYQDGHLSKIYPVAVGKMLTQTPIGSFDITGIYKAPAWHVPRSIQEETAAAARKCRPWCRRGPITRWGRCSSVSARPSWAWASMAPMRRVRCRASAAMAACA